MYTRTVLQNKHYPYIFNYIFIPIFKLFKLILSIKNLTLNINYKIYLDFVDEKHLEFDFQY